VILGLGGIDVLAANHANVTLDGGPGDDQLFSFSDGTTFIGGPGDDMLFAGSGADVFKYSFTQGQGSSSTFTQWLQDHGNGGSVTDTDGVDLELTDGTTQNFFSMQYTAWLNELVETFGLGSDTNGDGVIDVGLNQNDPDGTPFIEGVSDQDLAEMFGDPDSFMAKTGKTSHERFYADSFSTGDGGATVTSADGFDTIVEFDFAHDKLDFDGLGSLTLEEFTSLFKVTVVDADNDGTIDDTQLALLDDSWGVSLLDDNGVHGLSDFHGNIFA
jgi:hypothetical protein